MFTASSADETLEIISEIKVIPGQITQAMFARGNRLHWAQNLERERIECANNILPPEFIESDVVLTSAKGIVGNHLADHAMALLLELIHGIVTAVRKPGLD